MRTRRWATLTAILLGLALGLNLARAEEPPAIEMYKLPDCTCCKNWARYLEQNGFTVKTTDVPDVAARTEVEKRFGVPPHLSGCHTAVMGPYVLGGHVSAEEIRKLLAEALKIRGLFVKGMPKGAPGMEGGEPEKYDVIAIDQDGRESLFATHPP